MRRASAQTSRVHLRTVDAPPGRRESGRGWSRRPAEHPSKAPDGLTSQAPALAASHADRRPGVGEGGEPRGRVDAASRTPWNLPESSGGTSREDLTRVLFAHSRAGY